MEHGMQKKIFRSGRQGKVWSRFWQPTVQKRKAALIIGMSFTDHMHLEPHQAPFRDVEAMAQLLKSVYDFDSTVVLSDKEGTPEQMIPTQANIMRELATFIPSNPQSDYFFVFKGHSSKGAIDAIGLNDQREAEYIIPYDGIDSQTDMVDLNRIITDQTLHKLLVADLPPNSQLVALFDSCNSGTLLDLPYSKPDQIQDAKDHNSLSSFLRRIKQFIMTNKQRPSSDQGYEIISRTTRSSQSRRLQRHKCNNVNTSASWFAGSHSFTIAGGHFYSSSGPMTINQVPQNEIRQDISAGPFLEVDLIQSKDVHLRKEIHKGQGYRLHVGENAGKAVVVKVFEGRDAKKTFLETGIFNKNLMHPCFLRMVAAASRNSDLSFLVFSGDYEGSVESIMSVVILQSLEKSFALGLQTVVDLSSGLDYLQDVNYPILEHGPESFVLLLTHLNTVVISFDPNVSSPSLRKRWIELHGEETRGQEHSKAVIGLFSGILQKVFYPPCEEHHRYTPHGERLSSLTSELNIAQLLNESTSEDLPEKRTRHDHLSLQRISRDTEAILKSFSSDPSLERHYRRPLSFSKNSTCFQRSSPKAWDCGHLLERKRACITECILPTSRKENSLCSRCPDHFCNEQEEEGDPKGMDWRPSIDVVDPENVHENNRLRLSGSVEASNTSGGVMIETVANFLKKDPSPTYGQLMRLAIAHIWMSGSLT